MRRFLLLPALLPACSGPVPVFWLDARSNTEHRGSFDRIEEACEFWGLECYESDDDENALTILLDDVGAPTSGGEYQCGQTVDENKCAPFIWSCDYAVALEHEIGHAFRLNHRAEPTNVMHEDMDVAGDETTEWQRDKVHRYAARLSRCSD